MQGGSAITVKEFVSRSRKGQDGMSAPMNMAPYGAAPGGYNAGPGYVYGAPAPYGAAVDPYGNYGYGQMQSYGYPDAQGYAPARGGMSYGQHRYNPMGGPPPRTYNNNMGYTGGNPHPGQHPQAPQEGTLFVFHLPSECNEDTLNQIFSPFAVNGPLLGITVVRNKVDGSSKGYGFINYATQAEAANAMEQMNGSAARTAHKDSLYTSLLIARITFTYALCASFRDEINATLPCTQVPIGE